MSPGKSLRAARLLSRSAQRSVTPRTPHRTVLRQDAGQPLFYSPGVSDREKTQHPSEAKPPLCTEGEGAAEAAAVRQLQQQGGSQPTAGRGGDDGHERGLRHSLAALGR